jgi:diadenosine tetraphosphatase ApaH/serine/threonine PP2A family protein phosphatase
VNAAWGIAACLLLVTACAPTASSTPPGTATSSPQPSTTPASTSALTSADWTLVPLGNRDKFSAAYAVALIDDELIAVGGGDATWVWTSRDGKQWNRETLPGNKGSAPSQIVEWGDRVIVAGHSETQQCEDEEAGEANFWVRGSDRRWARTKFDRALCAFGIWATAARADRVVAVGGAPEAPYSLFTDDGLHWAPGTFGLDPQAESPEHPSAAAVLPDGRFISGGARSQALWISADGVAWASVPAPPPVYASTMAMLTGEDRVTMFTSSADGSRRVLATPDGTTWVSATAEGLELDAADLRSLKRVPGGLVAIGYRFELVPAPVANVSADGTRWRSVPLPQGATTEDIFDAAVIGDRAVLVGALTNPTTGVSAAAAWYGPAALLAP